MTLEEARLFFPVSEDEDLADKWEEVFFEFKQFFVTRAVVKKVFLAKLSKLEQQCNAYQLLSGAVFNPDNYQVQEISFSNKVIDLFQDLFSLKNAFKQKILTCNNPLLMQYIVKDWIDKELVYATLWQIPSSHFLGEKPIIAKEPDPMILLGAIRTWDKESSKDLKDLKQNLKDLPEVLLNEVKRLSLLSQL